MTDEERDEILLVAKALREEAVDEMYGTYPDFGDPRLFTPEDATPGERDNHRLACAAFDALEKAGLNPVAWLELDDTGTEDAREIALRSGVASLDIDVIRQFRGDGIETWEKPLRWWERLIWRKPRKVTGFVQRAPFGKGTYRYVNEHLVKAAQRLESLAIQTSEVTLPKKVVDAASSVNSDADHAKEWHAGVLADAIKKKAVSQPVDGHPTPEWARRCTLHMGDFGQGYTPCGKPSLPDTELPRCAEHASKYRVPVPQPVDGHPTPEWARNPEVKQEIERLRQDTPDEQ